MTIQSIKQKVTPTLREQGVIRAALFGSVIRHEDTQESDVDMLVEFGRRITLLDLSKLKIRLEEKLERKVDVLTYSSIHPRLRDIILDEQQVIYG
ncbi:nucleotidyltransferase family protein [candidate division WWE3 bacterium]|nr:nucleotidyltransferase family protein [candidate division WWE3 bacterium]